MTLHRHPIHLITSSPLPSIQHPASSGLALKLPICSIFFMFESIFTTVRSSEWIHLFFATFFIVLALLRPLTLRRRVESIAFGATSIGLTFAGILGSKWSPSYLTAVARDLLPALLILFVYWQSGRFYVHPNQWIQQCLLRLDDKLIGQILRWQASRQYQSWLLIILEFAYLLCYPLVPVGVGVLYAFGLQHYINYYWVVVLLSTYLCYVPLPFVQMLPPRMLDQEKDLAADVHKVRTLNLVILNLISIQVNTFPSAHVASTIAVSLVILSLAPIAGWVFLVISLSIAVGAVLRRYHYAADAILAIVVACLVFYYNY